MYSDFDRVRATALDSHLAAPREDSVNQRFAGWESSWPKHSCALLDGRFRGFNRFSTRACGFGEARSGTPTHG